MFLKEEYKKGVKEEWVFEGRGAGDYGKGCRVMGGISNGYEVRWKKGLQMYNCHV